MGKLSIEELEKMTKSQLVCTQNISFKDKEVFGDNKKHTLEFNIFDGLAYAENYNGHEVVLHYPRMEFVNVCSEMKSAIRAFMGLDDTETITVTDILQSYCSVEFV